MIITLAGGTILTCWYVSCWLLYSLMGLQSFLLHLRMASVIQQARTFKINCFPRRSLVGIICTSKQLKCFSGYPCLLISGVLPALMALMAGVCFSGGQWYPLRFRGLGWPNFSSKHGICLAWLQCSFSFISLRVQDIYGISRSSTTFLRTSQWSLPFLTRFLAASSSCGLRWHCCNWMGIWKKTKRFNKMICRQDREKELNHLCCMRTKTQMIEIPRKLNF